MEDGAAPGIAIGPPQVLAVDLSDGRTLWSWGGMGSMPSFGQDPKEIFGKTLPEMRVVASDAGTTFEGEWYVPVLGGPPDGAMRLLVRFDREPHPGPQGGMMEADLEHAVDLPSR